ncbi:MAG: FkbM family methyltransferase [Spirochaetaceae bacterium]|jgi:FkbM family methyltransferase|nr:FkbM family methyltransferase [Spirochaetaceae bacterium]
MKLLKFTSRIDNIRYQESGRRPVMFYDFLTMPVKDRSVIIYGAGGMGRIICKILADYKINMECFCDADPQKQQSRFCAHHVISPESLTKNHNSALIILAVGNAKTASGIYNFLTGNGFLQNQIVAVFGPNDEIFGHPFLKHLENETYIDVGCMDGQTIISYLDFCKNKYRKIIGFEPDKENYKNTMERISSIAQNEIEIIHKAAYSSVTELRFDDTNDFNSKISKTGGTIIETVELDDILENVNGNIFIKMNIEGGEMQALIGAENTIHSKNPRLAIKIEHKPEDIIEIPCFLNRLVPKYKFYIRHYNLFQTSGTTLFAIV